MKRDWRKTKRYVTGEWKKARRQINEERMKELFPDLAPNLKEITNPEGITDLRALKACMRPLFQQIKLAGSLLKEELVNERKLQELLRKYNRQVILTVNLDNCNPEGIPSVEVFPKQMPAVYFRGKEFDICFRVLKNGVKHELGCMRFNIERVR